MKIIPIALANHYRQEVLTIAHLWRLKRTDGLVLGFTDHDRAIPMASITVAGEVLDALTYGRGGFTPTAMRTTSDLSVDGLDVDGVFDSLSITDEDVRAGLWDHAEVLLMRVNYEDLSNGFEVLGRGWTGEKQWSGDQYRFELRSLAQKLQQNQGRIVTPECGWDLGSDNSSNPGCGVDLGPLTTAGTVVSSLTLDSFEDTSRAEADQYFRRGYVTWLTGDNAGVRVEVKSFAAGVFELQEVMPKAIGAGDTYSAFPGCDKLRSTCHNTFNNVINFGGFPDLPGRNELMSPSVE